MHCGMGSKVVTVMEGRTMEVMNSAIVDIILA
jgi:hypothetical protein